MERGESENRGMRAYVHENNVVIRFLHLVEALLSVLDGIDRELLDRGGSEGGNGG